MLLRFDYVNYGEAVFLQILHTGKSNEDIDLYGRVLGAGRPRKHLWGDQLLRKLKILGIFMGPFSLVSLLGEY